MNRRLLILCIYLLLVSSAFAGGSRQKSSTLTINHYDGTVEYKIGSRTDSDTLDPKLVYDIDHDEKMRIVLKQTNPLLFTYAWEKGTPVNTLNFDQFSTWADAVKGVVDILKPFAPSTNQKQSAPFDQQTAKSRTATILEDNGVTQAFIDDFVANADRLIAITNRIPGDIKKSGGSWDQAVKVRDGIVADDVPALAKKIREQLATIDKASLAVMKSFVTPPSQTSQGPREVARVASLAALSYEALISYEQQNLDPTPPRGGTQTEVITPKPEDQQQTTPSRDLIYDAFLSVRINADRIREIITAVEKYAAVASRIGAEKELAVVAYDSKQDQPFSLTIDPVSENASIVESSKLPHGKFEITVGPSSPVDFQYDAAAVYTFIEANDYDTVTEGGVTKIVRTDSGNEVNGLTGAAMLSIVPRGWNDPVFGRGFQIGFSPMKDKLAILAGATLRFFDRMSLGAGFAYQQTERLAGTLEVGQTIEKPELLKTEAVFKPGFYFTLSIKIQ